MKYAHVLQHSEEDCGAACLASIAKHYQRDYSLPRARQAVGTSAKGTTLLGLKRGAENLGFNARPVRAADEHLGELNGLPLPAIIHWRGNHWVVLYGVRGGKVVLGDPAVGVRHIELRELRESWANLCMLVLTPDENRWAQLQGDQIKGIGQFIRRVWTSRQLVLEALVLNVLVGLLALALPVMMQILTDDVLVRGDVQLLTTVALAVITMNLFRSAVSLVQSQIIAHVGQHLQLGLTMDYGFKLLRLPLSYFDQRRSGEVISRIGDVRTINQLLGQLAFGLPSQFFIALVSLVLMSFYSITLTLFAVGAFVLTALVNLAFVPALRRRTQKMIVESTENHGFLVETFRGAQVLKTANATHQAWDEYQRNFGRLAHLGWNVTQIGIYSQALTSLSYQLTSIGLLWMGGYIVIAGHMSIGQLLAFSVMSGNFLNFLSLLVRVADEFISSQIVVQRLGEVLEAEVEDDANQKPWVEITAEGGIECRQIHFHHPGRVDLLKDFNLVIPGGKTTAIFGPSGCGKSTLAKLLAGLYELQSGNIRYGTYNQGDLSLACLRQQVVLIPQDAHFWTRSVIENFRLCHPQAEFKAIVEACVDTGADEFIQALPDKYQTVLGEFGANLSGGQKQRLAIARAIVDDPPILIMDESTAALDPVSESAVFERLLQRRKNKTTVLISHRDRVIRQADWLVYLEEGHCVEQGVLADLAMCEGRHRQFID